MRRRGRPEFLACFAALQEAVRLACEPHVQWEARVVAGVQAALRFAGKEPEMAHVLIVQGRRERTPEGDREREVTAHFAKLLAETAPAELHRAASMEAGVIEAIATLIRGHLRAGTERQLATRAPDLVYLVLMPYLGTEGASRWAESLEGGK